VLENSAVLDYWTEKLADAYLGAALPIYYGCPNLSDYFSPAAYVPINLDTGASLAKIERVIDSQLYEHTVENLRTARELVLNKYNLFPMLCEFCNTHNGNKSSDRITLLPMESRRSSVVRRLWRKLVHKLS
jgi:hypothetical protein